MKRMKKLIAALMAVAMIASLNISAFATQTTPSPYSLADAAAGDYDSNDRTKTKNIGDATANNGFATADVAAVSTAYASSTDKAQASVTSPVAYEGKMPEGVVNIVMPAVPAGTFNMLLDPNNLIGEVAAGGEGATQRISGITANSDYVYFANAADPDASTEAGWSSTSDSLKITNKGYWPLSVKLTAEVEKGTTPAQGALIQLVDAKNKLNGADFKDIPAMYMEVTSGNSKGVVADSYGTPSMIVGANGTEPQIIVGNPIFAWDATNGKLNRDRKILNNALNTVVLEIKATAPTISSTAGALSVLFADGTRNLSGAAGATFKVQPDGTYNSSDANKNTVEITIAQSSTATDKFDLSDGKGQVVGVYNIQMKKSATDTAKTYATLKFAIDPVNVSKHTTGASAVTPSGKITFATSNSASTGSTSVTLGAPVGAYMVSYDTNVGGGSYVKTLTSAAKDSGFAWPSLSFNVSAAINKTTAWDDMANTTNNYTVGQVTNLNTKIIWDVQNDYSGDDTVNKGVPKVKVTKYAVNTGDSIEFTVDFGKGSKGAIAVIGLDAGLGKISCPTIGTPDTNNSNVITELVGKDGKWQTFVQSATGATANAITPNQLFQCSPKTVSAGAKATLTYLKPDLTTDTVEFIYGLANA